MVYYLDGMSEAGVLHDYRSWTQGLPETVDGSISPQAEQGPAFVAKQLAEWQQALDNARSHLGDGASQEARDLFAAEQVRIDALR